jgi:hypothetical protein
MLGKMMAELKTDRGMVYSKALKTSISIRQFNTNAAK